MAQLQVLERSPMNSRSIDTVDRISVNSIGIDPELPVGFRHSLSHRFGYCRHCLQNRMIRKTYRENLENHSIPAGGAAIIDLHFDPAQGTIVEDKTTCDGTHLYTELPFATAMENLSDTQIISIAETILSQCSRENDQRPLSDANKCAFDKLVAEYHCDIHEIWEIKEAIEDYYS
jgi:hypothetical protein